MILMSIYIPILLVNFIIWFNTSQKIAPLYQFVKESLDKTMLGLLTIWVITTALIQNSEILSASLHLVFSFVSMFTVAVITALLGGAYVSKFKGNIRKAAWIPLARRMYKIDLLVEHTNISQDKAKNTQRGRYMFLIENRDLHYYRKELEDAGTKQTDRENSNKPAQ
mmetsp:Transcript_57375/g.65428  ORF Transcript_57375/g.65428 Transcript_57375/m.65428 type:complete len:167 (-) Transcript_57375:77-577(-)